MSSFAGVVLSAVTGLFLGALFFGGLWWTISESQSSKNPAFLFTASLLLRTLFVLCGFYFACGSEWQRMLSCLLGFVLARVLVTHSVRLRPAQPSRSPEETRHAT
jgi:F1F0 ATPase subunit 2